MRPNMASAARKPWPGEQCTVPAGEYERIYEASQAVAVEA